MAERQYAEINKPQLFKQFEEKRLDELFKTKCSQVRNLLLTIQDGTMDLTNFILLALERSMVSNKYGLDIFYTSFKEAAKN